MSESEHDESGGGAVPDEELPEDLRPGPDNPLAEPLPDAETAGDLEPGELLEDGKSAEQHEDQDVGDHDDNQRTDDSDGGPNEPTKHPESSGEPDGS